MDRSYVIGPLLISRFHLPRKLQNKVTVIPKLSIRYLHNNNKSRVSKWRKWLKYSYLSLATIGVTAYVGNLAYRRDQHILAESEVLPYEKHIDQQKKHVDGYHSVISEVREMILKTKVKYGIPGIAIAVSIDGEDVWKEGFGYSDIENGVPCTANSVMRIASISKPITMSILAKLMENGMVDLDKPVEEYVKNWPKKTFEGQEVKVTTRMLVSHLSGLRHYEKDAEKVKAQDINIEERRNAFRKETKNNSNISKFDLEYQSKEMHNKEFYNSVDDSLNIFKDDPLIYRPGTKFLYSSHAWTLVSAVIESVSGIKISVLLRALFKELGMNETYLDENSSIIYNRCRYYERLKNGELRNGPYTDNSYKWAGGGLLSTVSDLVRFGNVMLYSYQYQCSDTINIADNPNKSSTNFLKFPEKDSGHCSTDLDFIHKPSTTSPGAGFLSTETVKKLWTPISKTDTFWDKDGYFGLGWFIVPFIRKHGFGKELRFCVLHTGGAIGASSVLLCLPAASLPDKSMMTIPVKPPKGVVVAIISNIPGVGMDKLAYNIAKKFDDH